MLDSTSKPTYVSSKIFNENLVAVHKIKESLTLNRPAYIGMCILDLSKPLMYNFHYNYIKQKYNIIKQNYYSQTLIVCVMKLKQKMHTKIFLMIKINLISVIIQKNHHISTKEIKK